MPTSDTLCDCTKQETFSCTQQANRPLPLPARRHRRSFPTCVTANTTATAEPQLSENDEITSAPPPHLDLTCKTSRVVVVESSSKNGEQDRIQRKTEAPVGGNVNDRKDVPTDDDGEANVQSTEGQCDENKSNPFDIRDHDDDHRAIEGCSHHLLRSSPFQNNKHQWSVENTTTNPISTDKVSVHHVSNNKHHTTLDDENSAPNPIAVTSHNYVQNPKNENTSIGRLDVPRTLRSSSLPLLSKRRSQCISVRCHYSHDMLRQKITEAVRIKDLKTSSVLRYNDNGCHFCVISLCQRRFGSKKDYFSGFSSCEQGRRINVKTRSRVMEYFVETGRYIKFPISPFSIHMAIGMFDRYMSHISERGSLEAKNSAAKEMEVGFEKHATTEPTFFFWFD